MNLAALLPRLRAWPDLAALNEPGGRVLNLPRAARPPVLAAWLTTHSAPTLILTARSDRAQALADELLAWEPGLRVMAFPEPNPLFYEKAAWGEGVLRARMAALAALTPYAGLTAPATPPPVIVASARAVLTRTVPRREVVAATRTLKRGQKLALDKVLAQWVELGYEPASTVTAPGQFARRGGIVDVYPITEPLPVRLEFFGDEVDILRTFDPETQRSGAPLEAITLTPAREAMPRLFPADFSTSLREFYLPQVTLPASLLDHLPASARVVIDDWYDLADMAAELAEQAASLRQEALEAGHIPADFPAPHFTLAELEPQLRRHAPMVLAHAAPEDWQATPLTWGARFAPGPRFGGQVKPLVEQLHYRQLDGHALVLVTRQAQRLADLWAEAGPRPPVLSGLPHAPAPGEVLFVEGALAEGWTLTDPAGTVELLTDSEIFGWSKPAPRRATGRAARATPRLPDYAPGDYVVHIEHGIGIFRELAHLPVDGAPRDYLRVEYAHGDELFVPVEQADRLTRYVAPGEHPPTLSRLGHHEWQAAKGRAQQAAELLARELLDLYARRELAPGRAFSPDGAWQMEMEAAFPYVETADQLRALAEVKADMQRPRPMDRLICGDVGYGKTEVALRAAFKAVTDGTQVAVLVPTTVLAQQHYRTFSQRLAAFPVTVEMLSRFRTQAESKAVLNRLEQGTVDIVIGTHKLLSRQVRFKNLGLLIIDEEQRFGVTHKERLKRLRTEVDVLTLTATPIPRTLYLSLTGVRDISNINTPPEERLPVLTHTGPYQPRLVRQAILRELDRGGQIFFVHNRVHSIDHMRDQLADLVPEARLGVGHGQMDEHELAAVMEQFSQGELDILLSTSIIESGLDIPNANTLIVNRADRFGLAQLYQLRGRVGRGALQAYAYFFTDPRYPATPEARERLNTLQEQTELGAGYAIAMRDLEMRGAGDMLGARQSGHIGAVGFHLYTKLLTQAVKRLRANPSADPASDELWRDLQTMHVDLALAAALPESYVSDLGTRLELYQRLAEVRTESALAALATELADRFGPVPEAVADLLFQVQVKLRALPLGIKAVTLDKGQLALTLPPLPEPAQAELSLRLGREARLGKQRLWLPRTEAWRTTLLETLAVLAEVAGVTAPGQ